MKIAFRMSAQLLMLCSGLLLISISAFSQGSSTGRILGTITDQSGGAIGGATVAITDTQRGTTRTLTTNDEGAFNAPELIPGIYLVKAEFRGFKATERQNIGVEVGGEYRVDLTLQPGEQTQTITVSEALPLVETTSAVLGGAISNQLIADLPVQGRNFTKLLELRPGVYLTPGSGKWSQTSNGMRNEYNVYILNGMDTIEGFSSQSVVNATGIFGDSTSILPIDAIQEFNTQQVPKAEYGWKPGAIVNVGLKSGTNSMHGTAYSFGRTDALDARNPFLLPGSPKQTVDIKDFGGTIGGPIKKDKLFYLLGYEGQRNAIGAPSSSISLPTRASLIATGLPAATAIGQSVLDACNALAANPATRASIKDLSLKMSGLTHAAGAANCGVDPTNAGVFQDRNTITYSTAPIGVATLDNGLAKIDFHLNEKHTITGEYFAGNFDGLGPQNNAAAQPYWNTFTHAKTMVFGAHWTWLPTSSMVNELRGGFNRYNQISYAGDCTGTPHPDYSYLANMGTNSEPIAGANLPANCGFPAITIAGGFSALGCCSTFPKTQGPDWTTQVIDNVSYIKGRHSMKFGEETRHLAFNGGTYGATRGSFAFINTGSGASLVPALQNFLTGTLSTATPATELVGDPTRHVTEWAIAGFAQDDWRMNDRFTLNLGMRYETVTPMKEAQNRLANFDPNSTFGIVQVGQGISEPFKRGNNFSPRVGFAWDIKGNSKWVLRSGASIIYVIEGYSAFLSQQNVAGISVLGLNTDPTGALLNGVAGPGNITAGNVQFPQSQVNWTVAGPVLPTASIRCDSPLAAAPNNKPCPVLAVDPNFRRPYATSWNLSIQHPFTNNVSLQVAYVGTHGTGLFGLNDINKPAPGSGWQTLAGSTCTPDSAATVVGASINATCENISRPYFSKYPYLSNIVYASNQDVSNYNGLQATLTQRPWHGLSYLMGYTWAHALDDGAGDQRDSNIPSNPFNLRQDYGDALSDVRQRLTLSLTYALPQKKGYAQMLEGWKFNSVLNVQTPIAWNAADLTDDISGVGEKTDRWNYFGSPAAFSGLGSAAVPFFPGLTNPDCVGRASALDAGFTPLHPGFTYMNSLAKYGCYELNGGMLAPPAFGTYGTMPRNLFRERGLELMDMSLSKEIKITERFSGQFRFEVFNVFNHTSYATAASGSPASGNVNFGSSRQTPDVAVSNPAVGSGAARGFQLGLKLAF